MKKAFDKFAKFVTKNTFHYTTYCIIVVLVGGWLVFLLMRSLA